MPVSPEQIDEYIQQGFITPIQTPASRLLSYLVEYIANFKRPFSNRKEVLYAILLPIIAALILTASVIAISIAVFIVPLVCIGSLITAGIAALAKTQGIKSSAIKLALNSAYFLLFSPLLVLIGVVGIIAAPFFCISNLIARTTRTAINSFYGHQHPADDIVPPLNPAHSFDPENELEINGMRGELTITPMPSPIEVVQEAEDMPMREEASNDAEIPPSSAKDSLLAVASAKSSFFNHDAISDKEVTEGQPREKEPTSISINPG